MPILKELKKHKLLLDTHVWIWSLLGSKQLSKAFQKVFEQALKQEGLFLRIILVKSELSFLSISENFLDLLIMRSKQNIRFVY